MPERGPERANETARPRRNRRGGKGARRDPNAAIADIAPGFNAPAAADEGAGNRLESRGNVPPDSPGSQEANGNAVDAAGNAIVRPAGGRPEGGKGPRSRQRRNFRGRGGRNRGPKGSGGEGGNGPGSGNDSGGSTGGGDSGGNSGGNGGNAGGNSGNAGGDSNGNA